MLYHGSTNYEFTLGSFSLLTFLTFIIIPSTGLDVISRVYEKLVGHS